MLAIPAYAKINLALEVVGQRPDGYHDLDSVIVQVDWHDLVSVSLAPSERNVVRLRLTGPACADVPTDERNLAVRAGREMLTTSGRRWHLAVTLDKRIPAGAGLAGGSADAAAVLRAGRALLKHEGTSLAPAKLVEIAELVGSDVPALLEPSPARIGGRGERITRIAAAPLDLVVVPTVASSTQATFGAVNNLASDGRAARIEAALASGLLPDNADLGSALEGPATTVSPELSRQITAIRGAYPAYHWHLTGSGGALFAVISTREEARSLAESIHTAGHSARACRTIC